MFRVKFQILAHVDRSDKGWAQFLSGHSAEINGFAGKEKNADGMTTKLVDALWQAIQSKRQSGGDGGSEKGVVDPWSHFPSPMPWFAWTTHS